MEDHFMEEEEYYENYVQQYIRHMPWWLISILLHIIILCFTIIIMLEGKPKEENITIETTLELPKEKKLIPEKREFVYSDKKKISEDIEKEVSPNIKETESRIADREQEEFDEPKKNNAMTDTPLDSKFTNKTLGIGGNKGGMFGKRFSGRKNLLKKGGDPHTEKAVLAGLLWLKRHQEDDGRWSCSGYTRRCKVGAACKGVGKKEYAPAMTGLALLCYLGAGNTTSIGKFKEQVKRGCMYLKSIQSDDGCFGPKTARHMYNHAIATLAITEAYALSNYNPMLKNSAQRAVNFLVKAQSHGGGWSYSSQSGDDDTSVMGWCIMALKAAKAGEIGVSDEVFLKAKSFLDSVTSPSYNVGYRRTNGLIEYESAVLDTKFLFLIPLHHKGSLDKGFVGPKIREAFQKHGILLSSSLTIQKGEYDNIVSALGSSKKRNSSINYFVSDDANGKHYIIGMTPSALRCNYVRNVFAKSEAMTAVSLTSRIFMGITPDDKYITEGAKILSSHLPRWSQNRNKQTLVNFYYWYYGTLAMFQISEYKWSTLTTQRKWEKRWKIWNDYIKRALLKHQEKIGCQAGSWNPEGKRCNNGGRVFATALNILSLEIYYRYGKVFH